MRTRVISALQRTGRVEKEIDSPFFILEGISGHAVNTQPAEQLVSYGSASHFCMLSTGPARHFFFWLFAVLHLGGDESWIGEWDLRSHSETVQM